MKRYAAVIASIVLAAASVVRADSSTGAALNPDMLKGKNVFDSAGKQLGDIDNIVKDKTDKHMAVIGLEHSAKEVVIPVNKLSMAADGKNLTTTLTREQLEALPDYDPGDMKKVKD
jgi:hypothetical protein